MQGVAGTAVIADDKKCAKCRARHRQRYCEGMCRSCYNGTKNPDAIAESVSDIRRFISWLYLGALMKNDHALRERAKQAEDALNRLVAKVKEIA